MYPTMPTLCPPLASNRELCPLQYGRDTKETPRKKLNLADHNLPSTVHNITNHIPSTQVLINHDIVDTDIYEADLYDTSLTSDICCNDQSITQDFPAYFVSNSSDQPSALTTFAESQLKPEHASDNKPFRKSPAQLETVEKKI